MRESSNIFNWLGMKQEHKILSVATQHLDTVLQCVKAFEEAMRHFFQKNNAGKEAAIEKVREHEQDADKMRVEMVRQISEGIVSPIDRQELLKFVMTLDRIADWTNGAARLLVFLHDPLPDVIMNNFISSTQSIVHAVEDLKRAVEALLEGKNKQAIELSFKVNEIESAEDDRKQVSLSHILTANLSTPRMLVAYNLTERLESITDKIEDASDYVNIIAIKSN